MPSSAPNTCSRWLPRGTHSYDKLVTPAELADAFRAAGLSVTDQTGVMYVPIADRWRLTRDMDVNYMMAAEVSAPPPRIRVARPRALARRAATAVALIRLSDVRPGPLEERLGLSHHRRQDLARRP